MSGLREIATFYDPEEAYIALGYLHTYGYDAILPDHMMLTVSPDHRIALGGFRILAPNHQAEAARACIGQARRQPNRIAPPCPTCNGSDYRRIKAWWFPAIFFFLMGAIVPFATNSGYLECRNCKTRLPRDYGNENNEPRDAIR